MINDQKRHLLAERRFLSRHCSPQLDLREFALSFDLKNNNNNFKMKVLNFADRKVQIFTQSC